MRRLHSALIGLCLPATLVAQEPVRLNLEGAVALALAASPELKTLVIQRSSALDAYRWGLREYLPKLGVHGSRNQNVVLDSPDTRSIEVGLTVSQLIFDAGRGGRRRDLARLALETGREDYRRQEEQVTDSVTDLFNHALVLKKKLEIEERVIDLAQKQLALGRVEWTLGTVREVDVLEIEAQLSSLQINHKQSQRNLADNLFQLAELLGMDASIPLTVEGEFDTEYLGIELPERTEPWLAQAIVSSRDLLQQRLERRRQYFALQDAGYWYLPDVTLEASFSLSGEDFPLQTPVYGTALTVSFPIDAFPVSAKTAWGVTPGESRNTAFSTQVGVLDSVQGFVGTGAAEAQYRLAAVKSDALEADARYAFEKALGDDRLLVEKLALQRGVVAIERKKNSILAKQVELGGAKRLDLLEAETKLADDLMALIESVLQLKETERALERLLLLSPGGLARAAQEVGS